MNPEAVAGGLAVDRGPSIVSLFSYHDCATRWARDRGDSHEAWAGRASGFHVRHNSNWYNGGYRRTKHELSLAGHNDQSGGLHQTRNRRQGARS